MLESKVRNQYNQVASMYDQRWNYCISNTLSFLKTWAALPPAATVLDIACGTGELERLILAEHPTQQMVGVDISEQMLEVATVLSSIGFLRPLAIATHVGKVDFAQHQENRGKQG